MQKKIFLVHEQLLTPANDEEAIDATIISGLSDIVIREYVSWSKPQIFMKGCGDLQVCSLSLKSSKSYQNLGSFNAGQLSLALDN